MAFETDDIYVLVFVKRILDTERYKLCLWPLYNKNQFFIRTLRPEIYSIGRDVQCPLPSDKFLPKAGIGHVSQTIM